MASLKRQIRSALIKAVRRTGEDIFHLSQQTELCYVPRRTGFLAMSGYTKSLERGIEIGYTADYSAKVEFGSPGGQPIEGGKDFTISIKAHTVRQHNRKGYTTSKGYTVAPAIVKEHQVKAYTRTIHGGKLIGFQPRLWPSKELGPMIFRILKKEPPQRAQYFLTRAVQEKIKTLPQNIEFYLKRIPGAH